MVSRNTSTTTSSVAGSTTTQTTTSSTTLFPSIISAQVTNVVPSTQDSQGASSSRGIPFFTRTMTTTTIEPRPPRVFDYLTVSGRSALASSFLTVPEVPLERPLSLPEPLREPFPSVRQRAPLSPLLPFEPYTQAQVDESSLPLSRSFSLPSLPLARIQEYSTTGLLTTKKTLEIKPDDKAKLIIQSAILKDNSRQNLLERLSTLQKQINASVSESTKQQIMDSHAELAKTSESDLSLDKLEAFAKRIENLEAEVISSSKLASKQEMLQQRVLVLKNSLIARAINEEKLTALNADLQELEGLGVPVYSLQILVRAKSQLKQLQKQASDRAMYFERLQRIETALESPSSMQGLNANEFKIIELENKIHTRDASTNPNFLMDVIQSQLNTVRESAMQAQLHQVKVAISEDPKELALYQANLLKKQQDLALSIFNQADEYHKKQSLIEKVSAFNKEQLSSTQVSQLELIEKRLGWLTASEQKQAQLVEELADINNLLLASISSFQANSIESQLNAIDKQARIENVQYQRQLAQIEQELDDLERQLKLAKLSASLKRLDEQMKPLLKDDGLREELMRLHSHFTTHSIELDKESIDSFVTELNDKLALLQSKVSIALATAVKTETAQVKVAPPVPAKSVKIPPSSVSRTVIDVSRTVTDVKAKKKPAFTVPSVTRSFTRVTKRFLDEETTKQVTDQEKPSTSKALAFPRVRRGALVPSTKSDIAEKDMAKTKDSSSESELSSVVSSARSSAPSSGRSTPLTDKTSESTEKTLKQVSEKLKESVERQKKSFSIKITKGTALVGEKAKMEKFKKGSEIKFSESAVRSKIKASVVDSTQKAKDEKEEFDTAKIVKKAKDALAQAKDILSEEDE